MKSILIFGNGLTIDTYNNQYNQIEKVFERVNFYITNENIIESSIYSKLYYPDLVEDIENNNNEFLITARRYLDKIIEYEDQQNYSQEFWANIVLFNSYCDYVYKLFWYYHRISSVFDSTASGINNFIKLISEKNKTPIIISLNYDLVIEKHLNLHNINYSYYGFDCIESNDIKIFKPHGSINFLSNLNDPNDNGFCSTAPFYPFTNDDSVKEKNPLYFRCKSVSNTNKLGSIIYKEKPMYTVEIVPPGCSNLLREQTNNRDYILPWAKEIYEAIFSEMSSKKNLILIGLSFWSVDQWELIEYINKFLYENHNSIVYILRKENDNSEILKILQDGHIDIKRINFINGSFSEKYKEIIDLL